MKSRPPLFERRRAKIRIVEQRPAFFRPPAEPAGVAPRRRRGLRLQRPRGQSSVMVGQPHIKAAAGHVIGSVGGVIFVEQVAYRSLQLNFAGLWNFIQTLGYV